MATVKFYLIADPHFYKNSLGAHGREYDEFMRYEQKCYAETEAINRSVFEYLEKADEADIVLIAGDLTFNGEKESHLGFIELLAGLRAAGKRVFVVTADHDCKAHPFSFDENGRHEPEPTPREELFGLYRDYGFSEAIAVDEKHLSYVAQLGEGVRLLALNNDYDGKREFDEEQLAWIKEQADKAREDGQIMLAMNHYPLLPGQPIFSVIPAAVQKNAAEVADMLADAGVHMIFTGHMHNQSVNVKTSAAGNKLYDVCTGSVIADPAIIRHVTVGSDGNVAIKSIPTPDFEWDTDGRDCKKYLADMFDSMILNILADMKDDPGRMMSKFGAGGKKKLFPLVKLAGRLLNSLTVGGVGRLLWIRCDKSLRKMPLKSYAAQLVRGIFEGNQSFTQGTPEGDLFLKFLKRINFVLKKIKAKTFDGQPADMFDILKNTAGNYDLDDYNLTVNLTQ